MKVAGIRQMKARFSEYVRLAKAGETILVSDRDVVVAELGPARHQRPEPKSIDATLDRLAEQGRVTRAGEPKKGWTWKPVALGLEPQTVDGILDELRSDR